MALVRTDTSRTVALLGVAATSIILAIAIAVSCAIAGCSKKAASGRSEGAGAGAWIANGATACDRYLKPDVVAAILTNPAGTTKTLSPQSCTYSTNDSGGSLTITLMNAGPATFDDYQKYLTNPVPLAGVGDKASQSVIGIVAVKGADRSCSIDSVGAPGSLRLRGAELGQKLGAICNQLFALP